MTITLSFDPLHILGIIFLSVVASFVGNILAGIIVGFRTPSLDGQKFYVLIGLAMMAASMLIPKFVIAFIATGVAMVVSDTPGAASLLAACISGGLGFLFTLYAGDRQQ